MNDARGVTLSYAGKPFISDSDRADAEARNRARHDRGEPHVAWSEDRRQWVVREPFDGRWRNRKGVSPTGKPFVRGYDMFREAETFLDPGHERAMDEVAWSNFNRQRIRDEERRRETALRDAIRSRLEDEWEAMRAAAKEIAARTPAIVRSSLSVSGPDHHLAAIAEKLADMPYLRHICVDVGFQMDGPALYASSNGLSWEREDGYPGELRAGEWERRRRIGQRAEVSEAWGLDPRLDLDALKREIRTRTGIRPRVSSVTETWPQERIERLVSLWLFGFSAAEVGRAVNASRNAVIGKSRRLGLPPRTKEEADAALVDAIRTGTLPPGDMALIDADRMAGLLGLTERADDDGIRRVTTATRDGQSEFRSDVVDNHGMVCAITGTTVAAVLQAAHLIPYSMDRNHSKSNGLMMRADIHLLFDEGLICIDPFDMKVLVSASLDGTPYEGLRGTRIELAGDTAPDPVALAWRMQRHLERERGAGAAKPPRAQASK